MNTQHTPGPWVYAIPGDSFIASSVGIMICRRPSETASPHGKKNWDANARLIAAAPDLLAALESILGAHDTKNNGAYMGEAVLCHHYAETAREAIALARGES